MEVLPPLTAIRAFDAVARHLSFTRAAAELGMTQAAVSYQIRVLEDRLGPLFRRSRPHIALTPLGRRLAPDTREALALLARAYAQARAATAEVLSITVLPTFAAQWLASNIGAFQLAHPDIAVRLDSTQALEDLSAGSFDLAIRSGRGDWPGLEMHRLMPVTFTPMMAPALARQLPSDCGAEALLTLPLIDEDDPWWRLWFAELGVQYSPRRSGTRMGAQHLEAQAAMAGRGAAMLTPFFYGAELAQGRLVRPFDHAAADGQSYYLCHVRGRVPRKVALFRDWLLPAFAQAQAG